MRITVNLIESKSMFEYLQHNFEATLEMFLANYQDVKVEHVIITSIYNKRSGSSSYPSPK